MERSEMAQIKVLITKDSIRSTFGSMKFKAIKFYNSFSEPENLVSNTFIIISQKYHV